MNLDKPDNIEQEIDKLLERYEGRMATYEQRYNREHHDRHHYEQDIEYAKEQFKADIRQLVLQGQIEENKFWAEIAIDSKPTHYDFQDRIAELKATLSNQSEEA